MIDTKYCKICQKRNKTLYWHRDPDTNEYWCWCNSCDRGYSIHFYCHTAGIPLAEFLKGDFDVNESKSNEVQATAWPARFIPLSDPRSQPAVDYIKSRGLSTEGDMYYDIERNGVVFPYYFGNHFVGAQTRFMAPRVHSDGVVQKIDTMPGTRLGLLFGMWNQAKFMTDIKAVGVCEGYLNALSLQQAFNIVYGGVINNPWKFICTSGSGIAQHHKETLKELKDQGIKIIAALDSDEAGLKGLKKLKDAESITHYAIIPDTEKDWNNLLQEMGHTDLAKFFINIIKKI